MSQPINEARRGVFRGGKHGASDAHGGRFERLQERYSGFAERLVRRRRLVLAVYCLVCLPALLLARRIGTELFPEVDTGQFQLRVRAPDGMRLEDTERIVREVDQLIRDDVGADSVEITSAALTETACNGFSSGRFLTIGPLIVEIFGFGDAMPR